MIRKLSLSLACCLPALFVACSSEKEAAPAEGTGGVESTTTATTQTLEIGCGSCLYGMEGVEGCQAAVVVGDNKLLVTGDHGFDAHAAGICSGAKQAELTGAVEGGEFVASAVTLKPE